MEAIAKVDDGGNATASFPGSLPGQRIRRILASKQTADLGAAIMGNLIKDILGDEPDLRDVVAMQKTLVATLQGGGSEGTRTKG